MRKNELNLNKMAYPALGTPRGTHLMSPNQGASPEIAHPELIYCPHEILYLGDH